jgi:alanine racemase
MMTRRDLMKLAAAMPAAALGPAVASAAQPRRSMQLRPGGGPDGFDPWIEVIGPAFRHNAAEVSRLAGGRPILAVIKNNGYGIGDQLVGPLLDACREIFGIACVRPAEALAMRAAGVRKPILTMAELGEEESADLVRRDITLSCWFDDAPARLARVARRARRRVPVHLYLDTGMNREGMPIARALPWMDALSKQPDVRIDGVYQMFVHDLEFDAVQLQRFTGILDQASAKGVKLGVRHAAASYELHRLPATHLDMVRVGNALFGSPAGEGALAKPDFKVVYRLKTRVARVERVEPGESAGFGRAFKPALPTSVALLPIGHTDGYPSSAAGACEVLIGGRLYPVVGGGIASAHTLVDVGAEPAVRIGDVATLVGPDHPAILPAEIGSRTKLGYYQLMTKFSALLPRHLVDS